MLPTAVEKVKECLLFIQRQLVLSSEKWPCFIIADFLHKHTSHCIWHFQHFVAVPDRWLSLQICSKIERASEAFLPCIYDKQKMLVSDFNKVSSIKWLEIFWKLLQKPTFRLTRHKQWHFRCFSSAYYAYLLQCDKVGLIQQIKESAHAVTGNCIH